jgi:hypothetical protein
MSTRWLVAGCFFFALPFFAAAQDLGVLSEPSNGGGSVQVVPILTGTGAAENSDTHFQATINPLVTQRAPGTTGDLADSADESVDFGWQLPIFSMVTIGYDTGVNAFRQDQTIWDDEEATSVVTTALTNKGSIIIQTGPQMKWTPYIQYQQSMTDGQPGWSDATKYGADASWNPVKDVTTVGVDASTQQAYNFNQSILDTKIYTASIDQKLPWIPFTLHTAGTLTDDQGTPELAVTDSNSTIIDASLLWKIVPSTAATVGVQGQQTTMPASVQLANTGVYFGQISLQAAQPLIVTFRAAHEQTDTTQAGQFFSASSDVLLTFGLTFNLGDRFNLGAGVNYRTLQSQSPTPAINAPPASVTLSAGGNF